jgi:hypothetical protein
MNTVSSRKLLSWIVAAGLVCPCLSACSSDPVVTAATCSKYQYGNPKNPDNAHPGRFPLVLIGLDLYSNSSTTATAIAQSIAPYVAQALRSGAYVKVMADGGNGTALSTSGCFDGNAPFLITRNNSTLLQKNLSSAEASLGDALTQFIRETRVVRQGSATRLLDNIAQETETETSNPDSHISSVEVIIWSNLLGDSSPSDCLNANRSLDSPIYAAAIAQRCFSEGQITAIQGVNVRLIGAGYGARTQEQSQFAILLAGDLCYHLSRNCKV